MILEQLLESNITMNFRIFQRDILDESKPFIYYCAEKIMFYDNIYKFFNTVDLDYNLIGKYDKEVLLLQGEDVLDSLYSYYLGEDIDINVSCYDDLKEFVYKYIHSGTNAIIVDFFSYLDCIDITENPDGIVADFFVNFEDESDILCFTPIAYKCLELFKKTKEKC